METHGINIYGFWDGDFTFHHVDYEGLPGSSATFRVRIDNEDPEERHRENTTNPNQFLDHPHTIRPATQDEIARWMHYFAALYPLRGQQATDALRYLRLHGSVAENDSCPLEVRRTLLGLARQTRHVTRDFVLLQMQFVERVDGVLRLTDEGEWLTSLMK